MTTISRPALNVPYAMDRPDRVPVERYYDPEFFAMENELLWPRVWQMACYLEDVAKPGDYIEYKIMDRSVLIVRVDENTIKAYENTCRHRGVRLASGRGNLPSGFTCPFHGWCWGLNGENTFVYQPSLFNESQKDPDDIRLGEVRAETAVGMVFINFDKDAPPLRESISQYREIAEAWQTEDLRVEWWLACDLPVNWKLGMEAFMEGYHVMQTHPQLLPPNFNKMIGQDVSTREAGEADEKDYFASRGQLTEQFDGSHSRAFIDAQIEMLRVLSIGMGGMVHMNDVRVAEGLRDLDLTADPERALQVWTRHLNDAVMAWHRQRGARMPDLNYLVENNIGGAVNYCFPNYFLLPVMSSASAYRIIPTGPESCRFELWSLTRYPEGQEPTPPPIPIAQPPDHEQWPPIPAQDYSNLPIQQKALHNPSFKFMRLSDQVEGLISRYQRLIDGYLAGLGYDELTPAAQIASDRLDVPIRDIGF